MGKLYLAGGEAIKIAGKKKWTRIFANRQRLIEGKQQNIEAL